MDWLGPGTEMELGPGLELVGVYLRGEHIVGLEGCEGVGKGGQSVSEKTRGEGTSWREGMGCVSDFGLVVVDVVRQ